MAAVALTGPTAIRSAQETTVVAFSRAGQRCPLRALAAPPAHRPARTAHNVIVVVCNSLHLGFLGAYGNAWIETPNLDRLAAESIVFDDHFPENLTMLRVRMGEISEQIQAMADEEVYYWFSKVTVSPTAGRSRRALRVFLAEE